MVYLRLDTLVNSGLLDTEFVPQITNAKYHLSSLLYIWQLMDVSQAKPSQDYLCYHSFSVIKDTENIQTYLPIYNSRCNNYTYS